MLGLNQWLHFDRLPCADCLLKLILPSLKFLVVPGGTSTFQSYGFVVSTIGWTIPQKQWRMKQPNCFFPSNRLFFSPLHLEPSNCRLLIQWLEWLDLGLLLGYPMWGHNNHLDHWKMGAHVQTHGMWFYAYLWSRII